MRFHLLFVALIALPAAADLNQATLESKVFASTPRSGAMFGAAVAIDGETAVVGAERDQTSGLSWIGAAYVFDFDPVSGTWSETAKLVPADVQESDLFAYSVGISGGTIVVGAPQDALTPGSPGNWTEEGSAYVFERDQGGPNAWGEVAKLAETSPSSQARFGISVDIDGDVVVVGADGILVGGFVSAGAVYAFERHQGGLGNWGEISQIVASVPSNQALFGQSVSIQGDRLLVGAPYESPGGLTHMGAAYVFDRVGGGNSWNQVARLAAGNGGVFDLFGMSVSVHGDTAAIGSPEHDPGAVANAGAVFVYERDHGGPGAWGEVTRLVSSAPSVSAKLGRSVSAGEDTIVAGAFGNQNGGASSNEGSVLFFERAPSGVWAGSFEIENDDPSTGDHFGWSVSLSASRAAIGAWNDAAGFLISDVAGLAFDSTTGTLFGADILIDELLDVDPVTGAATPVGPFGFDQVEGLAFDPFGGVLYGSDTDTDQLIVIDPVTGAGTAVGPLGFGRVRGLTFDTTAGVLYGSDTPTDQLIVIDPVTGAGTAVGALGFQGVRGLAFDPNTGLAYGCDGALDELITIDLSTGAGTSVGTIGYVEVEALTFDPGNDILLGADQGPDILIDVDASTGLGSFIGHFSTKVPFLGSTYFYSFGFEAQTYCTAGSSASGCQAAISATGDPSATAPTGFVLAVSGVEGDKDGFYFFGTNGRQAVSWGNGTSFKCVVPPVKRTGLLPGTGTLGSCDGVFSQDLNALWCPTCPKPQKNPGAGVVTQAQLWYRDPFNTSNRSTSFSDAVEFCVAP